MAILTYNEITPKKYIVLKEEPYEVLTSHVFRKQMRKPVNDTKLKNLITGQVIEYSFHQAEKVAEADVESRPVKYLYNNRGEFWFCEENDASKRFNLPEATIGESGRFLKQNSLVDIAMFGERVVGIKVPIKMDLKVKEAPPAVRGSTVQGGTKQVTLETGVVVNAPLFINEGDIVRINTETGDYVERVEKK
ncbi:MAG: elongation factor P [Patescibacteria group bacterium]